MARNEAMISSSVAPDNGQERKFVAKTDRRHRNCHAVNLVNVRPEIPVHSSAAPPPQGMLLLEPALQSKSLIYELSGNQLLQSSRFFCELQIAWQHINH